MTDPDFPQVPGYEVLALIGSGGLADVYRARRLSDGQEVALKVMRDADRNPATVRRFLREGRLLAQIRHSGLPRCFEVIEGDRPILVMELLRGETLSERIESANALPADDVSRIGGAVLRTLAHLHGLGIVHRDLKSANIFLGNDRQVVLLDLGLAADPSDPLTTTLGDIMGTYAYMAPEQIAGGVVDGRSDLYSLGVTLYEALSGRRPFHATGATGYLRAHTQSEIPSLAELAPEAPIRLVDVVHRLMSRNPADRPQTAGVALAMLIGESTVRGGLQPPPLTGRAAAEGALAAAFDGGGVLHVIGPIGSGITRIAALSRTVAQERSAEVLAIRCRRRAGWSSPLEQLAHRLSEIAEPCRPTEADLISCLQALCGEGPVLLLIEDFDRAAPAAVQALSALMRWALEWGLTVVTTGTQTSEGGVGRTLVLRALERGEVERLVLGMLGASRAPAELVDSLFESSRGMPGAVVGAMRELAERRSLWSEGADADGRPIWHVEAKGLDRLSEGATSVLLATIEGLETGSRIVLDVLLVADEPLELETALHAAGVEDAGLCVADLERRRLVLQERREDEDWLVVRRAVRPALYPKGLPAERSGALHASLAAALEAGPQRSTTAERAAFHSAMALPDDERTDAVLTLADALLQAGSVSRVLDVLARSAEQLEGNESQEVRAGRILGEALLLEGRFTESVPALERTLEQAHRQGIGEEQGRVRARLAWALWESGDAFKARATLQPLEDDAAFGPTTRARRDLLRGRLALDDGALDEAVDCFEGSVKAALEANRRDLAARAHGAVGVVLARRGQVTEGLERLTAAVGFLQACPRSPSLVTAWLDLADIACRSGELKKALGASQGAELLARRLCRPALVVRAGAVRALVHLEAGDVEGAESILLEQGERVDRFDDVRTRALYRTVWAEIKFRQGDRQAALIAHDRASLLWRDLGGRIPAAYHEGMAAVLTADGMRLAHALDTLRQVHADSALAALLVEAASVGEAEIVLPQALELALRAHDPLLELRVRHARGERDDRKAAKALVEQLVSGSGALSRYVERLPGVRWVRGAS